MRGNTHVRFSDLFADTVRTHGLAWAWQHYTRNGMPEWEIRIWLRGMGVTL